jgi:penicillin-binding protein 1C
MRPTFSNKLNALAHWCSRQKRKAACGLALVPAALGAILLWPMDASYYLRVSASGEMQDCSGRLLYAFLNPDEQWSFARELSEVSPRLISATIAAEDQRFFRHRGVDLVACIRAVWQNLKHRRVISGASTLTMQVVKRGDRTPRSLVGKVCQAVQAIRLELRADKKSILRAYLNRAPYGLNLVGCEAAARRFFGKPSAELTLAEAALIAGLPKSPTACAPLSHPEAALRRRNYVLRRMLDERFVSPEEFRRALAEPLRAGWRPFPSLAPHLAMLLKPDIVGQGKVRTTLLPSVQTTAEHLVRESLDRTHAEIGNAAALVIDAPSASILARVGAADFSDTSRSGQVDVCRSPRSPGSALKPFTYALAMERGCLYAGERLLDSSLDYGLYDPENFDRRYRGLVSASYALRRSLNIPAIAVLERVGYANVHSFLRDLGFTTLDQSPERYGLGLTLGNCEVKLEELAAAYCMLANLGEHRPLQILSEAPADAPRRCLSRGVCLKLYEMLEQPLPAELGGGDAQPVNTLTRVAWKTGTSTGHHDAWAFVFNRHYVVGVWMGNSDGAPSDKLVGAEAALPLAAKLFRALPPKSDPDWPEAGSDLYEASVCALSGLPATAYCPRTTRASFPRNQFLNRRCDMHYPARSGLSAVAQSSGIIERWPATARGWNLARISAAIVPNAGKNDTSGVRTQAFRILCPPDKAEYVLTGERNGDRIHLRASLDEQMPLHWYADEVYLGTSTPQSPLHFDLTAGTHKVTCMTPDGLVDQAVCSVALPKGPRDRPTDRQRTFP